MSPTSRAGVRFAAALALISTGAGGKHEIRVLIGGAAVALVLADGGLGSYEDQNVLVAALLGLGRMRARAEAGALAILDAEAWSLLRRAIPIIDNQQAIATPDEVRRSVEVVLDRVMNQRTRA